MLDEIDARTRITKERLADIPRYAVLQCCIEDEPKDERIITCKGICECLEEKTRNNNTEMVACKKTSFDAMECVKTECIKRNGNSIK